MDKFLIRKQIKKILDSNQQTLEKQSKQICNSILDSKVYKDSQIIMAYMPLNDEVNIVPLIYDSLEKNKKVYLPRIISGTNKMDFYSLKSDLKIDEQVKSGSYGILEPEYEEKNKFEIQENIINSFTSLDKKILFLVPGRAFSKSGKRIGRGKGFYDIYFSSFFKNQSIIRENVFLAGVCFKDQIMEESLIETDENDFNMDGLFFSFA